jgi:long-chain acyl-CoA synthetase
MGYYKQDELTKETITADGWLKTGDIVEINSQTLSIRLIDRKKNIFKLSQGEYVAPDKVENLYLGSPLVTEVFVHGESTHHFAVAIVTPNKDNLLSFA